MRIRRRAVVLMHLARAKETRQKWLRRPLTALRELLRRAFIPDKLRSSKSARLAIGHARALLQSFPKSFAARGRYGQKHVAVKTLGLVTLLALNASAGLVQAAPPADWAPSDGLHENLQIRMDHLRRSRCLPDSAEVALPIYPAAVVISVDWGRVQPRCAQRDGWRDLGAIVLVSRSTRQEVVAWYADKLVGFAQYPSTNGLLFIRALIPDFLWERDYYKYRNVAITAAPAEWNVAGYPTVIELNRPAAN